MNFRNGEQDNYKSNLLGKKAVSETIWNVNVLTRPSFSVVSLVT